MLVFWLILPFCTECLNKSDGHLLFTVWESSLGLPCWGGGRVATNEQVDFCILFPVTFWVVDLPSISDVVSLDFDVTQISQGWG